MRILLTALIFFLFTTHTNAQAVSSSGRQFHVSFYINGFASAPNVILYLSSRVNTSGTISNPNTGYSVPFTIAANSSTRVTLSAAQCVNVSPFTPNNLGLIVSSNDSISVFARNLTFGTEDVSLVLPEKALATSYLISNARSNDRFLGVFLVQATENNTRIEINPSVNLSNNAPAGQPFVITLNRGQTYLGAGAGDLSGTTIKVVNDCKPIAVFTGSPAAIIPSTLASGAEHLFEQLLPDYMMGLSFITPVLNNRNSALVKITTGYNGTSIFRNGTLVAGPLAARSTFEFETNNTPQYIESSMPVQVALLGHSSNYDTTFGPPNLGDPTLILLSPVYQTVTESVFSVPENGPYQLKKGLSVICKTSDAGQMQLNGRSISSAFQPVPGNIMYSHALVDTDSGYHRLSNPHGFQAYVSAASFLTTSPNNGATAYGFNTAVAVEPLINHFSCNGFTSKDTLTATLCPGNSTFLVRAPQPDAVFTWNFGDGSAPVTTPGTVVQQVHNYTVPGTYEATLTITAPCFPAPIVRKLKVLVRSEVIPVVKILASVDGVVCTGSPVSFRAMVTNAGNAPSYQWLVNGLPAGTDNVQFGPVDLNPNDIVKCVVTTSFTCTPNATASDSFLVTTTPLFKPEVTISTPSREVCPGTPVTFTAQTAAAYREPSFRWLVNGVVQAGNAAGFTYTPANNDRVWCVLTVADDCALPPSDTSNTITMVTLPRAAPTITIQPAGNNLCKGSVFVFSATTSFGGPAAGYNWLVNGISTGVTSADFSATLANGDTVSCIFTSSLDCVTEQTVRSNPVVALVRDPAAPVITIGTPRTSICQNEPVFVNTNFSGTGVVPTLEWYINSRLFASNNSGGVQINNLLNGDTVAAVSLGGVDCLLPARSNILVFRVTARSVATAAISSTVAGVCRGADIRFFATQTNGGDNPVYRWRVNGLPAGTNAPALTLAGPAEDVRVQLELVSSNVCVEPVLSNLVEVKVFQPPVVGYSRPDTVIRAGTTAILSPLIQTAAPVLQYTWLPPATLSNPAVSNPVATPLVSTRYLLRVTDLNNCSSEAGFEVKVSGNLLMPTAFTPNKDGLNDIFSIPGNLFIDLQQFTVYNRWGNPVFNTLSSVEGWDGRYNGVPLPPGGYAWMIRYRDAFSGETRLLKGTVMLIR